MPARKDLHPSIPSHMPHCRTVAILRGYKRTHQLFGLSNTVLPDSYVDRGELDEER
jgi:hypothetical protein